MQGEAKQVMSKLSSQGGPGGPWPWGPGVAMDMALAHGHAVDMAIGPWP